MHFAYHLPSRGERTPPGQPVWPLTPRSAAGRYFSQSTRGYTLVEIMIVVVVIGLLAAMALPLFDTVRRGSENSRWINDVRVIKGAAEVFALQNSRWPDDGFPGQIPSDFVGTPLTEDVWLNPTSLGGEFDWEGPTSGIVTAGISTMEPRATMAQLQELDRAFDDNDLGTGSIRWQGTRITYILEP